MSIILKDDIPVCQRARRLSCSEKLQVNDQIDYWLQQGIIRESCSDYCSPIVLCEKVNGAMKTSSVGSNSRSPTPSPMEETYNTVVVTNSGFPTVLSSSQNHAMPVIHNVSLLNLPDVEEVPSHDGENVLSVLPEPPISLNDIEPILHPQQQTT
ncbi:phosphatase and actin regulator 2 [Trichonephila clavipes]|nr:phosphatase and actin regulator 2 [Trichonephila clavipes]